MQHQSQRTTVKVTAGSKPAAAAAHAIGAELERDVESATVRTRYCEPGLARLLNQAPEGSAIHMSAKTDVKR